MCLCFQYQLFFLFSWFLSDVHHSPPASSLKVTNSSREVTLLESTRPISCDVSSASWPSSHSFVLNMPVHHLLHAQNPTSSTNHSNRSLSTRLFNSRTSTLKSHEAYFPTCVAHRIRIFVLFTRADSKTS